jgi:hypothetical protein
MAFSQDQGQHIAATSDTIYLLGSYQPDLTSVSMTNGYQFIARISAAALWDLDLSQLQIATISTSGESAQWMLLQSLRNAPAPPWRLFSRLVTEASLFYDVQASLWMVVSLFMLDHYLQMCSAEVITGPWSCSYVAEIPAPWQHPRLITYAAKVHPELLQQWVSSKILVSFVSNTVLGLKHLFEVENKAVYTPKFMLLEKRRRRS